MSSFRQSSHERGLYSVIKPSLVMNAVSVSIFFFKVTSIKPVCLLVTASLSLSANIVLLFLYSMRKRSHPRPRVTKLGPDDCVDWVFVAKPVLTTAVDDTALNTLKNIPG